MSVTPEIAAEALPPVTYTPFPEVVPATVAPFSSAVPLVTSSAAGWYTSPCTRAIPDPAPIVRLPPSTVTPPQRPVVVVEVSVVPASASVPPTLSVWNGLNRSVSPGTSHVCVGAVAGTRTAVPNR